MAENDPNQEVACPGPGCTYRTGSVMPGCTICDGGGTIRRWVFETITTDGIVR